jgi:hypothetical protein
VLTGGFKWAELNRADFEKDIEALGRCDVGRVDRLPRKQLARAQEHSLRQASSSHSRE